MLIKTEKALDRKLFKAFAIYFLFYMFVTGRFLAVAQM